METKDLSTAPDNTVIIIKRGDLLAFAQSLLAQQPVVEQPQPEPADEEPLSAREAEQFLGKSRQTIYNWRKQGIIKAYTLGGRVYFLKSELLSALKE